MKGLDIVITAAIAFVLTSALGIFLIPFLRKIKFGQPIIEKYGPVWHKKKKGTPTMGGFMFIIGLVAATVTGFTLYSFSLSQMGISPQLGIQTKRLIISLVMMILFAGIGFLDDYIKVIKKHNEGLNEKQKLILQILIAAGYLTAMGLMGLIETKTEIPFLGSVEFGWFYYPIALLLIVFFTNAVNLTDGIDGLCSSVTFFAAIAFMIISTLFNSNDVSLMATALASSLIGFLLYNFYPAKIMMGDTGSMFLGATLVAMAFSLNMPFLLIIIGVLYIIEALSVMIQITYFKITKKRLFKMSPIHHHFELSGYSEVKIVILFTLVTIVGCILAVIWAFLIK